MLEDLISPRPSIFLYIMQNSLVVAKDIRGSYKETSNWMGNLARRNLLGKNKLALVEGKTNEIWRKLQHRPVVFIDGGMGRTQIFTHTPIFIRVGIFKVVPGETDQLRREDFDFYPIFLGDLETGLRGRGDYPEIIRILSEVAALYRIMTDDRYSDVEYVLVHGPLLYRLSAFTQHKFSPDDYARIFNMNNDAFARLLQDFLPSCKCGQCNMNEVRAICMLKYLHSEIFRINKERGFSPIVMSVVEGVSRRGPPSREYTIGSLLPEIIRNDQNLVQRIFGAPVTNPSQDQLREICNRLQLSDMILLSLALKEAEFTEPQDATERYTGFTALAGMQDFAVDLGQKVPIRYSYLKSLDNSFAFRVEFPGIYNKEKIVDGLEKVLAFSKLLPNYAFPLGLEIVDKFARVPNWMIDGYRKYIFGNLAMVTENQNVLDEDIRRVLLFLIINNRSFFLRPGAE